MLTNFEEQTHELKPEEKNDIDVLKISIDWNDETVIEKLLKSLFKQG